MDCFFNVNVFKRMVLFGVLGTFPIVAMTTPPAYEYELSFINTEVNFINFSKLEKLINNSFYYRDVGDFDNLLDTVMRIKSETEGYTNVKYDLNKTLDNIENYLKSNGVKLPKDSLKKYKKVIHDKLKKKHHRSVCMDFESYEDFLSPKLATEVEGVLPFKLYAGITLMLGGAFVMAATPVCPLVAPLGETMMSIGFAMVVDESLQGHYNIELDEFLLVAY